MAEHLADVGRRLRDARLANRPDLDSIPKAARELQDQHGVDISEKQYGRWERGESEPRGSKRDALATMLRVRKEDIWGEPPVAPEEELRADMAALKKSLRAIHAEVAALSTELSQAEGRLTARLRRIERKLDTGSRGSQSQTDG